MVRRWMRLAIAFILLLVIIPAGCTAPGSRAPARTAAPERTAGIQDAADVVQRIEADPAGFLREVYGRSDALPQYQLTFYRQERLGLIPKLTPLERIRASFRREPFSVRFEWPDPEADYAESVYVAGRNDNKLIVRERRGIFGLPPMTRVVDVQDPVKYGRSRNPITDFGLARVARRTIDGLSDPQARHVIRVAYEGVVNLEPVNRPAYLFRIERPAAPGVRYTRQDFFVDAQTLLPGGTDLYLSDGTLDTRYRYSDVNTNVQLTDRDFVLQHNPDR